MQADEFFRLYSHRGGRLPIKRAAFPLELGVLVAGRMIGQISDYLYKAGMSHSIVPEGGFVIRRYRVEVNFTRWEHYLYFADLLRQLDRLVRG